MDWSLLQAIGAAGKDDPVYATELFRGATSKKVLRRKERKNDVRENIAAVLFFPSLSAALRAYETSTACCRFIHAASQCALTSLLLPLIALWEIFLLSLSRVYQMLEKLSEIASANRS